MFPASRLRTPFALLALLSSAALSLALTGCGAGPISQSTTASLHIDGRVFGGQQPVGFSNLQLWAAGTGGNATAAVPLVPAGSYFPGGAPGCVASSSQTCNPGVVSDALGSFTLTGDYHCVNSNDQVYITATQGDASPNINNPALLLIDVLGPCGNLTSQTNILINEVTTVAAAWALAPFLSSTGSVASSPTNTVGIANAFLNAQLLANPASGYAATLPTGLTIETGKLYALANSIASCVNSDGTTGCQALFAATTINGVAPANTLAAALNVVRNPGNKVSDVFNAASQFAPFPSMLGNAPNDWTMTLTVTGGGLYYPSALGIDSLGNVWVGDYFGALSGFSPQGTPFSATGFGTTTLAEVYGLTVDTSNNIWVTNEEKPYHGDAGSVTKFNGVSSGQTLGSLANGTPYLYGSATDFPIALSADTNGNIAVVNYGNSSASIFNSVGSDILDIPPTSQDIAFPAAAAFDATHGLWLANLGDNTVSHFDLNGNLLGHVSCCNGADGIATDSLGNAWVTNYYGSSISEVASNNSIPVQNDAQGGLAYPSGIVVDAGQNVWVANFHGASISEIAGNTNTLPVGTGISPATGYGRDTNLVEPFGIAVDAAGNVWVTNFNSQPNGQSTITMFFGLATPTATPQMPVPTAP
jgi:hypothetical protein